MRLEALRETDENTGFSILWGVCPPLLVGKGHLVLGDEGHLFG